MIEQWDSIKNLPFHMMEPEKVYDKLETGKHGLTEAEAQQRILLYGKNKINNAPKSSLLGKIWDHLHNIMVLILSIAAIIAFFVGDVKSALIIGFVIIMNTILGLIQENKAERALEALQNMSSPEAEVLRDGKAKIIKAEDLTMGDVVLLDVGDHIPADLRLVEAVNLKIEEAHLTGESVSVEKETQPLNEDNPVLGDRKNMAFMGSNVTYGRGSGIVTSVGMSTEIGKIAAYISADNKRQETPLQKRLAEMSKYISFIIVIASSVIFITGLLWGRSFFDMFLTSISLAVAAIPEGLPAIVTIVLALGVQKMAKRNAIIRKLPAVETLGSTQVICTDKTGTLTKNEMTVLKLYFDDNIFNIEELPGLTITLNRILEAMLLCNDTRVTLNSDHSLEMTGDPTETALVKFSHELNYDKNTLDKKMQRILELPFDSERKLMTTVNHNDSKYHSYTKGAFDILLNKCTRILEQGKVRTLTVEDRNRITNAHNEMTKNAFRIIAFSYKELETIPTKPELYGLEEDLIFIGFAAMIDPPRPEVMLAVKRCREAGIKPVMITGDHIDTASAIAQELGILKKGEIAIEGRMLDSMSDTELLERVENYSVYARVSPEHKVRIVKAWKNKGMITAMTGDGVNDAPALKSADISIGMGITGTDVAKGVSDMVLADDNFATIITTIEEGRKIYSNIRKVVHFLLSTHLGEVLTLFIATMLNWVILFPIHLLWVNLIIDTLPALALGMTKPEENIMKMKPRQSNQNFFLEENLGIKVIFHGFIKGLLVLASYYVAAKIHTEEVAITTAFVTLGLVQLAHTFSLQSDTKSFFKMSLFSNIYLFSAVVLSTLLQVSVVIVPALNEVFRVTQLHWEEWIVALVFSLSIIPIVEIQKKLFLNKGSDFS